jgi:CBS domain containing-hemolysin-like protein
MNIPGIIKNFFSGNNSETVRREIMAVLEKGRKLGVWDDASYEMMGNVLDFSSVLVREIMIPRTDITSVNIDDPIEEIHKDIASSGYTRLPVCRKTVDNIIGVLNVKDLLKIAPRIITVSDIMANLTKPYYIPETKNAHMLLYEFKTNRRHMAVVIDEYGGTSGLVTLKDLLETIVGDIHDEHQEPLSEEGIVNAPDGSIIAGGRVQIEEIEERLNIELEKGRYETIGGLILNKIRRIPHQGESFEIGAIEITIRNADERSIKKVKIKKIDSRKNDHKS